MLFVCYDIARQCSLKTRLARPYHIMRTYHPTLPPLLPLVVGEGSAAASSPARDLSGRAGTWRAVSARGLCIPGRTCGSCCRVSGRRGGIRLFLFGVG